MRRNENVNSCNYFCGFRSFLSGSFCYALILFPLFSFAQPDSSGEASWTDKISIRGYVQARYSGLLETNPDLTCEQCDRFWGNNGGFSLRRVRVIFFGQLTPRIYFYIQPDFASAANGSLNFGQIRDAYFDLGLDRKNEFRVRVGQSKMPFGFENMQSSQNRLPLDRSDALNSALLNERDVGVVFYWAPEKIRKRFATLVNEGYKGSGDYGVAGLGVYNGQAANRPDLNGSPHIVARLSYPFAWGSQIVEASLQGYSGSYVLSPEQLSAGAGVNADRTYMDRRVAGSFILYPRPFGIQAEYNAGQGPRFNKATDSVELAPLGGGYITLSYLRKVGSQVLIPFTRLQYYDGGKKHEADARSYKVNDFEIGVEWQPSRNFELVMMYVISSRRYEDYVRQENFQKGRLLRVQAQLNF
jgi:hypothetical protein